MVIKREHCCCVCGTPVRYARAMSGRDTSMFGELRELALQFRDRGYCTTSIAIELDVSASKVLDMLDEYPLAKKAIQE